ncbi:MAG: 1,4-alpha-glucan branching protein domain-containing protein [Myxococcota bacterium]
MADGAFCLVLHGHLPWVLHHGRWPHGEDWLFEAAGETWLPLIQVLDTLDAEGIRPGWTIGLMPILLEQLAHERFKDGMEAWLLERVEHARRDAAAFTSQDAHLAWLAERWAAHFEDLLARFRGIDRDIPAALRGRPGVELLTSNATHGYQPLILHDQCARAQIRAGLATSERHLLTRPRAAWLPECAYRPGGPWMPPALHGDLRDRAGVASLFGEEGVVGFVVDTHLVEKSVPVARLDGEVATPVDGAMLADSRMGWNSVMEPLRVVERDVLTPVTVLARCPDVSEQVWSGEVGYPGDGRYLEFHKRHGLRGLRYWRVTGPGVDLGSKSTYGPDEVQAAVHSHAMHFVGTLQRRVAEHRQRTGRFGVVCAPFDAELFGHWWHEGPRFLLDVSRELAAQSVVEPMTLSEVHSRIPADKAGAMPEGTWGAGGDHRVWLNDELRFYWELAYRAEDRFLALIDRTRDVPATRTLMEAAGRQLLLLQASDWPFVIHTRGAVDYGLRRILDHAGRFDDLCNGVEDLLAGRPEDPVVRDTLERCELVDPVFPDLDLAWWS